MERNEGLIRDLEPFKPGPGSRWSVGLGELMVNGKSPGTGDLSVLIRGSSQQVLGFRADWVIADDVTDREISRSPVESEKWIPA
jgi:hypothetical protein